MRTVCVIPQVELSCIDVGSIILMVIGGTVTSNRRKISGGRDECNRWIGSVNCVIESLETVACIRSRIRQIILVANL